VCRNRIATKQTAEDIHIIEKILGQEYNREEDWAYDNQIDRMLPLSQHLQTEYQDFEYIQVSPAYQPSVEICHPIAEIFVKKIIT